jgi:hypothetical protein
MNSSHVFSSGRLVVTDRPVSSARGKGSAKLDRDGRGRRAANQSVLPLTAGPLPDALATLASSPAPSALAGQPKPERFRQNSKAEAGGRVKALHARLAGLAGETRHGGRDTGAAALQPVAAA